MTPDLATIVWRNPLLSFRAPEWVMALYLFLLHFVWEMLQTPFFADMSSMPHWPATMFCLKATIGDVAIGVAAFAAAAWAQGNRGWFLAPTRRALGVYLAVGVLATIALESHAVASGRWGYSSLMPIMPLVTVGLPPLGIVPLVQWLVLPMPLLFLMRRHHLGASSPY